MKKIAITVFFLFCIGSLHSQLKMPDLSGLEKPTVDLAKLKQEIKKEHSGLLTESDIEDMSVIGIVLIQPDSISNTITYQIDSKYVLYFYKKKLLYFYETIREKRGYTSDLYSTLIYVKDARDVMFEVREGDMAFKDAYHYFVKLFPFEWEYLEYFYLKYFSRGSFHYTINSPTLQFDSLEELNDYYLGSPENYVELYEKRLRFRERREGIFR